ncbi:hypothetical protein GGD66_006181 [Bradyrhizobium sp. CIR48]|nr:hypothetical protein [Bradyrhizobium sp. CIR48]
MLSAPKGEGWTRTRLATLLGTTKRRISGAAGTGCELRSSQVLDFLMGPEGLEPPNQTVMSGRLSIS